jgi:hypothetical protein
MIVDATWYMPNMGIRRGLQKPTVKEETCRYSSVHCTLQYTPKRPSSEPHGATRRQANARTPAK